MVQDGGAVALTRSGISARLLASALLLEQWLAPNYADEFDMGRGVLRGQRRRWRFAVERAKAPTGAWSVTGPRRALPWEPLPTAEDVTGYGRYPAVFSQAGHAGLRYPVQVEVVDTAIAVDDVPNQRTLQHVGDLLCRFVTRHAGRFDRRSWLLVTVLCEELLRYATDVLLVGVAATPCGAPLDGELHLIVRRFDGRTLRLAVSAHAPAPMDIGPAPISLKARYEGPVSRFGSGWSAAPGWRVSPGWSADPWSADPGHAGPGPRITATTTLLCGFLPIGDHAKVTFDTVIEPHGLALRSMEDRAADAAFRSWWDGPAMVDTRRRWAEEGLPAGRCRRLEGRHLAEVIAEFERHNLERALLADPGSVPDLDDPEVRDGHLVSWLSREVMELLLGAVTWSHGDAPLLAYEINWVKRSASWDGGVNGLLVLVGPEQVAAMVMFTPVDH